MIPAPYFFNQGESFAEDVWGVIPYIPPVDVHGLPMPVGVAASIFLKRREKIKLMKRIAPYEPEHQL